MSSGHAKPPWRIAARNGNICNPFCSATDAAIPACGLGPRYMRAGCPTLSLHTRLNEYRQAIEDAETRLERLEQQIAELVTSWSVHHVIGADKAMGGWGVLTGGTFVAEIGD